MVERVRRRQAEGLTGAPLVRWLAGELGCSSPSRPVVFGYLHQSSGVPVAAAMTALGPWAGFGKEGGFDDDTFSYLVEQLIDAADGEPFGPASG